MSGNIFGSNNLTRDTQSIWTSDRNSVMPPLVTRVDRRASPVDMATYGRRLRVSILRSPVPPA